jgi:hypothetical protein
LGQPSYSYPPRPATISHCPDPIIIVATPSFVVELAYANIVTIELFWVSRVFIGLPEENESIKG